MPATTWRCSSAQVHLQLHQLLGAGDLLGGRHPGRAQLDPRELRDVDAVAARRRRAPAAWRGAGGGSSGGLVSDTASFVLRLDAREERLDGAQRRPGPQPPQARSCGPGSPSRPSIARCGAAARGMTGQTSSRDQAHALEQPVEEARPARAALRGVLRQLPGRERRRCAWLSWATSVPDLAQRAARSRAPRSGRAPRGPGCAGPRDGFTAARRHLALAVALHHGQRARDQVAQVVGQVGVVAPEKAVVREVPVLAERALAQEEVAHGVGPVAARPAPAGSITLPVRLAELAAVLGEVAVREHARGRPARPPPSAWPASKAVEADDLLADQVQPLVGALPVAAGRASACSAKPSAVM